MARVNSSSEDNPPPLDSIIVTSDDEDVTCLTPLEEATILKEKFPTLEEILQIQGVNPDSCAPMEMLGEAAAETSETDVCPLTPAEFLPEPPRRTLTNYELDMTQIPPG